MIFFALLLLHNVPAAGAASSTLWFVCAETNDVWKLLSNANSSSWNSVKRATVEDALAAANVATDGMLVLADGYPLQPTLIPPSVWAAAAQGLRSNVFIPVHSTAAPPLVLHGTPAYCMWETALPAAGAHRECSDEVTVYFTSALRFTPGKVNELNHQNRLHVSIERKSFPESSRRDLSRRDEASP